MTSSQLRNAGLLAMMSGLLAIPWFLVVYMTSDRGTMETKLLEGGLLAIGTSLYVYLSVTLRKLLNHAFSFTAADRPIALLIKGNIVVTIIGLLALGIPVLESSVAVVSVIFVMPLGIVQAWLGGRLLAVPHELYGLRNPYGWLNIVTGICQASIVLLPVALFTGAVADVMLGTIFLQSGALLRKK